MVGALLRRWPTLQALPQASPKVLRKFFTQHNCRSEEAIQERLQQIPLAVVATTDAALVESASMCIQNSVRLLEIMREGIAAFDRAILETYRNHPDRALMESFPGAGPALEPRLIAAVGSRRERFESATSRACFFRHRAGEGSPRQCPLDPLALGLSQVPPADVSRMGGMLHSDLWLGAGVLQWPTRQG